jgi:hypothetical protein
MVTGLARPDADRATIAGRVFADLPDPARIVGTLLGAAGDAGLKHLFLSLTAPPPRRSPHNTAAAIVSYFGLALPSACSRSRPRKRPDAAPRGALTLLLAAVRHGNLELQSH